LLQHCIHGHSPPLVLTLAMVQSARISALRMQWSYDLVVMRAAEQLRNKEQGTRKKKAGGRVGLSLPVGGVFGLQKLGLPAEAGVALFALQK
jgi:hypothetical protein